jgi:hypothetical protein
MKRLLLPIMLLVLSLTGHPTMAQDKVEGRRPSFILVELPNEQSRIAALTRSQNERGVQEVKDDAAAVRNAMMRDFSDHFTYCPVYYFMDSNLGKIKAQNFEGVLLDKDFNPLSNLPIGPGSKDYLVVRYGRPEVQPHRMKVQRDTTGFYGDGVPMGRGLIVSNYKLEQVHYITGLQQKEKLMTDKERKNYYYSSRHYQIGYYPLAKDLDYKVPKVYE